MADLYDSAIIFFTKNPDKILEVWDDPKSHWSGALFTAVTPSGEEEQNLFGDDCGDICHIKSMEASAWTLELTNEIRKDARIPLLLESNNFLPKIDLTNLSVFAEWQRRIDEVLGRHPRMLQN